MDDEYGKLCQELYKLSSWEIDEDKRHGPYNCPAYDLSYLLQKLPDDFMGYNLTLIKVHKFYQCGYFADDGKHMIFNGRSMLFEADTAEDALCKLAIELFEQGILSQPKPLSNDTKVSEKQDA